MAVRGADLFRPAADGHRQAANQTNSIRGCSMSFREMVGVEVFSRGTSELLGATRALKQGKCLGFLVDQDGGPGGA